MTLKAKSIYSISSYTKIANKYININQVYHKENIKLPLLLLQKRKNAYTQHIYIYILTKKG